MNKKELRGKIVDLEYSLVKMGNTKKREQYFIRERLKCLYKMNNLVS